MKVLYHPVADNPIRMASCRWWQSVRTLRQRLEELEVESGLPRHPAPWEPFSQDCLCCRDTAPMRRAGLGSKTRRSLRSTSPFSAGRPDTDDRHRAGALADIMHEARTFAGHPRNDGG